ncbi:MAG: 30S ribosomal protein S14 [Bacteroidota bacterium]|nr:30S ribosomal protein S14 [Bacteroidota bacterium]MDE2835641.1 30S ribosomal protein S14 [Bacteroidota bacterium]MDE2956419.1 30S ribosomal protein S14 [Bacteroidota bacterium]
MAKKSWIARQKKREQTVARYAERRERLRAEGDYEGLQRLPRNASPSRLRNRCQISGRARGYIRQYGVSRIVFRDLASAGRIPGIRKSSW